MVDRFLEHSRVFHFKNGGDEEVYLSSADWMPRNLDKRIELLFPVEARGDVREDGELPLPTLHGQLEGAEARGHRSVSRQVLRHPLHLDTRR